MDSKTKKNKNKTQPLIQLVVFLLGAEKPACSLQTDGETSGGERDGCHCQCFPRPCDFLLYSVLLIMSDASSLHSLPSAPAFPVGPLWCLFLPTLALSRSGLRTFGFLKNKKGKQIHSAPILASYSNSKLLASQVTPLLLFCALCVIYYPFFNAHVTDACRVTVGRSLFSAPESSL